MDEKVVHVILGIGKGISAEELAASVHDYSIDELIERKRAFAAGRQQGLREAAEWLERQGTPMIPCDASAYAADITELIEGEGGEPIS